MSARVGVDIGGTFTDGVLVAGDGTVIVEKTLTTPADLSEGFFDVFDGLTSRTGSDVGDVIDVMHASTVATNALLERRGARVGLLVTRGFRDVLEIGRQVRSELYNLFTQKPTPLVSRADVHEISERIDHRGEVLTPMDVEEVRSVAEVLVASGVDSIAICFLHAYRNPRHEQIAAAALRELLGDRIDLSISSEIAPEIKEFWRASTTCVNAYVGPVVRRYLTRIQYQLDERGYSGPLGIMHSGGGIEGVRSMLDRPFQMIESGPAAGVAGAAHFVRSLGYRNGLSFDMGGTTAKAGLILDGVSRVLPEFEVGAEGGSGAAVAKASGYPILGEVVDLVEVGAGGGSLAWIDDGGHLRVGPKGAGSVPGPACYGRGGTQPTITDANLVLGRLDANSFLGGQMRLDIDAARAAVENASAAPLGISMEEAALGIIAIANARMVGALRLVSIERGHDPADFCLVAFGGAGPLHAASLAEALGVPDVLIPPNPGVASAWGLLLSDVKHDVRRTVLTLLELGRVADLRAALEELGERLATVLRHEDVETSSFEFSQYVEARYLGQSSRLRISWNADLPDTALVEHLTEQFHIEHEREFGYRVPGEPIQVSTAGITATARRMGVEPRHSPVRNPQREPEPKGVRPVVFDDACRVATEIHDRSALPIGTYIHGPAVVEEFDSSTLVPPGFRLEVLDLGVLRLRRTQ